MSTSSYSLIEKLLEFQNNFINLVHSEILAFNEPQQKKEILRMSDKNESFNEMVSTLRKELIQDKQQADAVLKSYFTKLLDLDYLPFLHINRYQLTKLSIYGFDIYIDPLEAILQILNRLERTFYILQESLKQHAQQYLALKQKGSWEILLSGWTNYYIFLNFYKLSLNIYMLKEYIQTADTSLFKKDKQIVFTGVYNFYKKLVPRLIEMNQLQFLQELADLNNTMYSFHGSFDYFLFYTCLKPEKRFIKVYDRIKDLERKCKTTNILTPLLFGILNNFKEFNLFVTQVETSEYIHLLRVLLSGLIINFKLRILEYDQVLELIGKVITKLNLLKGMKFQIISGDLGIEWREAKDFFISAFKSGYNVGEIQTWNLCESQKIQPRIRNFLTEGTLLLGNCKNDEFIKNLQKQELEELLSHQIFELTSGNETLNSLTNNWKTIKISETQLVESKCLNVIRIVNLMNILENFSERLLYSVCSAMIEIKCQNQLLQSVLTESSETINFMITVINRKESISNLKYILTDFHKKYIPKSTFQDIVPVYLHCFIVKESLQNLISVIESLQSERLSLYIKQILMSLIQKYCPKLQNFTETLKNFQKVYKIPSEIVHMDSEITSVFTNLTKIISSSNSKTFDVSTETFINLLRFCPWYVVSVLNLPTIIDQKIESFLSWLIKSENKNSSTLLNEMLSLVQKYSEESSSGDLKEYLHECVYLSVLDAILNILSEITKNQKWQQNKSNVYRVLNLVELYAQIQAKFVSQPEKLVSEGQNNEKVCQNLIQLLSFVLKSCELSLELTSKSCQIYWGLIKRIKGKSINEWYQRMLLNLVFSVFISESLSSSESFNGVGLISSSKNYITSKEPTQNTENQRNSESLRYNFSEIKQFYDEKYLSFEKRTKQNNLDIQNSSNELQKIISESTKTKTPIKISSLHLANSKDSFPSLSESKISFIYSAFYNGSNQEKSLARFCLDLLKLNNENHKILWKLAKINQKSSFLTQLKFTRQTITQIFDVTSQIQKIIPEQSDQNRILQNMLNVELLSQNVNELELFSSSFYFESSKIQTFLKKKQQLWFFIVGNNANWRQFNDSFSNYLKNQNFLSTLLQYKEFLTITKKSSRDYEEKFDQFGQILTHYKFYIEKKIQFIQLLKNTDSQQENEIRKSTLLLNVKIVFLKCELQKMMERMGNLGKLMSENSLQNQSFENLLKQIHSLNTLCNILSEGNIQPPTFSYQNGYLTQNSESKQFLLGRWLENVERAYGRQIGSKYEPQKELFTPKATLQEFLALEQNSEQNHMTTILDGDIDFSQIHSKFKQLKESLKQHLTQSQTNVLSFTQKEQTEIDKSILNNCYKLGHLLYWVKQKKISEKQQKQENLSVLIQCFIKREVLPLEIVKEVDPSSYHHLKLVLIDQKYDYQALQRQKIESSDEPSTRESLQESKSSQKQPRSSQNFFIWRQKQLIQKGSTLKVTGNNKHEYIDLVSEQVIGKSTLLMSRSFALGYISGEMTHKK